MSFSDGPEYTARTNTQFTPPDIDLQALRYAIPSHAFKRSTWRALLGIFPIVSTSVVLFAFAMHLDDAYAKSSQKPVMSLMRWVLWGLYWSGEGIAWAGLWTIGHEADHNALSPIAWFNHSIGFVCHTWLFLPYFSWRITHLRHHQHTGSMEKDEVYIPYLRSELNLPSPTEAKKSHYAEAFDESPILACGRFIVMQLFGMHTYLTWNTTGSKRYPPGANHWKPSSGLFTKEDYSIVVISNIGILAMGFLLSIWSYESSFVQVLKLYFVPLLLANHWIVAMTFLQHSCPTVPFYRGDSWTRARGALSTVDRPFLGWVGEVFFLGLNHYHTTHHLFATIPFYNLRVAHEAIRPLLGDMYNYDSTGVFWALKRSFTECLFVEDQGGVLFYRDKNGSAKRSLGDSIL